MNRIGFIYLFPTGINSRARSRYLFDNTGSKGRSECCSVRLRPRHPRATPGKLLPSGWASSTEADRRVPCFTSALRCNKSHPVLTLTQMRRSLSSALTSARCLTNSHAILGDLFDDVRCKRVGWLRSRMLTVTPLSINSHIV